MSKEFAMQMEVVGTIRKRVLYSLIELDYIKNEGDVVLCGCSQ
jgi:hypothetical protein